MERLVWKSLSSQAKVVGTVASIAGAFIVTFYKGQPLLTTPKLHLPLLSGWVLGGFFLAVEAFMISLWYIFQVNEPLLIPSVIGILDQVCNRI